MLDARSSCRYAAPFSMRFCTIHYLLRTQKANSMAVPIIAYILFSYVQTPAVASLLFIDPVFPANCVSFCHAFSCSFFYFYFSCISLGLTRAYPPHYIRFSFFAEKDVIYLFMRCEYHSFRVIINTSNEFHNTCHKKKCSHYIYIEQFCACYYFFFFRDVALSMVPVV